MKRFLILLVAAMLTGQVGAKDNYDFSAGCSSGQTLYYKITSNSTVSVTYPSNNDSWNARYDGYTKPTGYLAIPSIVTYNNVEFTVTSIGYEAFNTCDGLYSLTIPNSVTSIGEYAFRGCHGLTSVVIPNSVTNIDANAFLGCVNLTSVSIPNSVTNIRNTSFWNCAKLKYNEYKNALYLGNAENPYVALIGLKDQSITSLEINEKCLVIADKICYGGNYDLTSITIPNSVVSIGNYAFYSCNDLTSITIGNNVSFVGESAFATNKLDYNKYDNAYYIGNDENPYVILMETKNNITSCTINDKCRVIYEKAFSSRKGLTSVTIPNTVTCIGNYAFYGLSLTSVTIPNSVTFIGKNAFDDCDGLTSVTIPNSVTSISDGIFSSCDGLTSVVIPNSITSIGENAFWSCSSLTSITIPNSVTTIGESAFSYCSNLTSIIIPESVINIGNGAFEYCGGLKLIISTAPIPPMINYDLFSNNDTIFVPEDYVEAYQSAPIWKRKDIVPFHIVTVQSNEDIGHIQSSHPKLSANEFICTTNLPLTAVPKENYHFTQWSDGNNENPRVFTTTEDTELTVLFEKHSEVTDAAVAATCTELGLTEGKHCSVCGDTIVAQEVIPANGHAEVTDVAVAATCAATGLTEGKHCSVCGEVFVAQTETPKIAHTIVTDVAVAATATKTGLTEGSHCSVCGAVIVAQSIIPALGEHGGENGGNGNGSQNSGNQNGNEQNGNENGENNNPPTAVSETAASAINIYTNDNTIVVENAAEEIRVYDAMGRLICRDVACRVRAKLQVNTAGVYIVKVGNVVKRLMVN